MTCPPAPLQGRHHTHGLNGIGIAQAGLGKQACFGRMTSGFIQGRSGAQLVGQRQPEQQDRTDQRNHPQERMKDEDQQQEYRRPGRIKQGKGRRTGQKLPQAIQVAQRLAAINLGCRQRLAEGRRKDPVCQALIQCRAKPHQDPAADGFEQAHHHQHQHRDNRQGNKGGVIATRQDAIEELQHVERRSQKEKIDEKAEHADDQEGPAHVSQGKF